MQSKESLSITRMGSRVICLETFGTKVRLDLDTEISQAHSWRTLAYVVLNLYNEMDRLRGRGRESKGIKRTAIQRFLQET